MVAEGGLTGAPSWEPLEARLVSLPSSQQWLPASCHASVGGEPGTPRPLVTNSGAAERRVTTAMSRQPTAVGTLVTAALLFFSSLDDDSVRWEQEDGALS